MEHLIHQQSERIAVLETTVKSVHKRLDDQARLLENMRVMSDSMKDMLGELKHIRSDLDGVKNDVEAQKLKPAKRWETLVEQAVALVCAAVIGGVLARVLG
jgi:SMC interacting uncharacterized protein involved in chromosome segregation